MRVLVIGAGASGLMAAIHAAAAGAEVTVLEGMEKPGKKLLTTGNGRCNLTNTKAGAAKVYRGSSPELAETVLRQYPSTRTLEDFESFGLFTQEKPDGGIYPCSGQAATVLEILLNEALRRKVKIKCREKAVSLAKQGARWSVSTESWHYEADRVILSCGSRAAPATGSDGSGYELAKMLGHRIRKPLPALVPLKVREEDIRILDGLRCPAELTLSIARQDSRRDALVKSKNVRQRSAKAVETYEDSNRPTHGGQEETAQYTESGELQWTSYGISGIVVFQLSRYAVQALDRGQNVSVLVNLLPGQEPDEIRGKMLAHFQGKTNLEVFSGLFSRKMASFLLKRAAFKDNQPATPDSITETLQLASALRLTVSGARSFENAQCCMGGVPLTEINPETMESRISPGAYLTGELLDVDGPCGGYNLQWAWSTGAIAGNHAGADNR